MATIERLLHVLLWAHPATTRKRYGDAIVQTILERVSHANGKLAASTLLLRECIGIVVSGARARRERARQGRKTAPRRRTPLFAEKAVDWFHDVRIASRSLWRRPWFSLPAILALALGVAAAVAIFSVFHAILLRPLPFAEPDRLVSIWEKNPERGWHKAQVAGANYLDWRSEASTFADMAAHNDWLDQRVLLEGGEPTIVLASEVTGNFFDVLGVPPLEGRPFDDAHTWAGLEPVVVLSQRFWSRHFGEDATVVGRAIELDGVAHRVLGIMPGTFGYPFREADLWVPVAWDPALLGEVRFRRAHGMRVVVRLAPGVFQVLTRQGRRLHMGWNLSGELIDLVLMFIMWSVMMVAMMVSKWLFVRVLGSVNGIVTWSDLQKPPVRMWLFDVITLIEMAFTRLIETLFPNDEWTKRLSPARRKKAEDFHRERLRRSAHALRLIDCVQFSDKGQILAKDDVARRIIGFPSRKRGEQSVKAIVSLGDKLAHAQDIVTHDGSSIVELARHLGRILEIGSAFPDLKRSTPVGDQ